MKKFTHHHITRHDNQIFVGTQNPIPEFQLNLSDQQTDNISNNQNTEEPMNNDQANSASDINNNNIEHNIPTDIKRCSSLPMQSTTFSYTVQEGDTLESISEKYHIRKSLIKSANRIFDDTIHIGQDLVLFTNFNISQKIDPIDVSVYDAKEQAEGPSGKLSIKNFDLVFTPKSLFQHPHHINLNGHLESSVFLHPNSKVISDKIQSDQPYILVINYLKSPPNRNTSVTEYFTGNKSDLDKFWIEILKAADLAQEKNKFAAPNPNSIYYSQEFADKANISVRNRRSNSQNKSTDSSRITAAATQTMIVFLPQIQFLNGQMEILKQTDVFLVRKQLSQRFQNLNWTRVFKTTVDGLSLATFFRRVTNRKPLLFFLKTTDDDLIGAFIPTNIIISENHYGSGEMFLFRFKTEIPKHDQITTEAKNNNDNNSENSESEIQTSAASTSNIYNYNSTKTRTILETFRWNHLKNINNRLFILSNLDCILFGGGKTSALYINKDMYGGYSDPCETFNSPRLTTNRKFDIALIEVWQIG